MFGEKSLKKKMPSRKRTLKECEKKLEPWRFKMQKDNRYIF